MPHFVLSGNRYKQRKRKLSASAKKKKEKALAATSSSTSSLCVLCSDVCFMRPESCGNLYYNKTKKTAAEAKKNNNNFAMRAAPLPLFTMGSNRRYFATASSVSSLWLHSNGPRTHTHTYGGKSFLFVVCDYKKKREFAHSHTVRNMRDKVMSMQLVNVLVI